MPLLPLAVSFPDFTPIPSKPAAILPTFHQYKNNNLVFDIPHQGDSFQCMLGSVGIHLNISNIPMADTDEIGVCLTAAREIGEVLLYKLAKDQDLGALDRLAHAIRRLCEEDELDINPYELLAAALEKAPATQITEMEWLVKDTELMWKAPDEEERKIVDMTDCPYLIGYSSNEEKRPENTVEAVADFICTGFKGDDLTIIDPSERLVLNTFGGFINRCPNQDYLKDQLLPVLIPKQLTAEAEIFGNADEEDSSDGNPDQASENQVE